MATNKKSQDKKHVQSNRSGMAGTRDATAATSKSAGKENAQTQKQLRQGQRAASHEEPETMAVVLKRLKDLEEQFAREQEEKQELEAMIEVLRAGGKDAEATPSTENTISRPAGTCSTNWSLQVEMGLAGSASKDAKYAALLRGMRDLVLNAGLNWEVGWREIPAIQKSKVFQVARERYPILKLYINDWATAEMIKQYIKNKRAHHYNNGWLQVPEKYSYLKENSQKRDPSGSRVKRAKAEAAAKKKAKRNGILSRKAPAGSAGVGMDGEEAEAEEEEEEEEEEGKGKGKGKGKSMEGEGEGEGDGDDWY